MSELSNRSIVLLKSIPAAFYGECEALAAHYYCMIRNARTVLVLEEIAHAESGLAVHCNAEQLPHILWLQEF